jgi:hypothetical protein
MKSILVRLYIVRCRPEAPGDYASYCCLKKICPQDQARRDEKDGIEEYDAGKDTGPEPFRGGQGPLWHTVSRWEKNGRPARKAERYTAGSTVSGQ